MNILYFYEHVSLNKLLIINLLNREGTNHIYVFLLQICYYFTDKTYVHRAAICHRTKQTADSVTPLIFHELRRINCVLGNGIF